MATKRQEQMDIYEAHEGWRQAEPSAAHQTWSALEFGMMFSYGVNTYNDVEWSDGSLPATSFVPSSVDTDQWCEVAKSAGARYVLPITKHMDGFCLWDTTTVDYGVRQSEWRHDIIEMVAQSAARHNLKLGLYYSAWDVARQREMSDRSFARLMKQQLTELLTRYGNVVEIWIDGTWSKGGIDYHDGERWHWREIYDHIKCLQPDCMVGVNPTTHHPGKIVLWPCDFRIGEKSGSPEDDRTTWYCDDAPHYLPWEGVYTLSTGGTGEGLFADGKWFWHEDDTTCHTAAWVAERLQAMRAAHGNLLLNAPVAASGSLRDVDVQCLTQVGPLIR